MDAHVPVDGVIVDLSLWGTTIIGLAVQCPDGRYFGSIRVTRDVYDRVLEFLRQSHGRKLREVMDAEIDISDVIQYSLQRSCPKCNGSLRIVIPERKRKLPVQAINGVCFRCGYRLAWIPIDRTKLATSRPVKLANSSYTSQKDPIDNQRPRIV